MKVDTGIPTDDMRRVPEAARQAEALGYDGLRVGETQHNPFLPLVLAAEHTQRLTFGPSVAIAFPRSPMITANESWDLQKYSNGRFVLGLGTQVKGHNERRFSVPWSPPGPRLREYILALRAIWKSWQTGERLNFQGDHYTFTLMTPFFNPGPIEQPHIPIFISAINPYLCRLAGEVCDGLYTHGFTTATYLKEAILPQVEQGLRKAGRSRSEVQITAGGMLATGANEQEVEQAKRSVRRSISFYGSTRTYFPVLEAHGWRDAGEELHELSLRNEWGQMAETVTDEMVETFAVVGTYDQIAAKIRARYAGLADRVSLGVAAQSPAAAERLRSLIQELQAIPGGAETLAAPGGRA